MTMIIIALGFLLMLFNTNYGLQLRKKASGGIIGERLTYLLAMIVVFALAYLGVGFLSFGSEASNAMLITAVILLMGAVFVTLVLQLVNSVMQALE